MLVHAACVGGGSESVPRPRRRTAPTRPPGRPGLRPTGGTARRGRRGRTGAPRRWPWPARARRDGQLEHHPRAGEPEDDLPGALDARHAEHRRGAAVVVPRGDRVDDVVEAPLSRSWCACHGALADRPLVERGPDCRALVLRRGGVQTAEERAEPASRCVDVEEAHLLRSRAGKRVRHVLRHLNPGSGRCLWRSGPPCETPARPRGRRTTRRGGGGRGAAGTLPPACSAPPRCRARRGPRGAPRRRSGPVDDELAAADHRLARRPATVPGGGCWSYANDRPSRMARR